jgi:hypothetical protein
MDVATARARAIIDTFHKNVAETEKQQRPLQTGESEQEFYDMYSPCNPLSTFHDLQCGHRIQTEYTASCGMTCVRPMQGQPFACPTCLIDVVRAEVALDSLTLGSNNDTAMEGTESIEERIQHFANKYVAAMLKKGYRGCKSASKIDEPRMQFFDQFMRQDGFGGVEDGPSEEKITKPRKRPGTAVHKNLAKVNKPYRKQPGRWDYRDPTSSEAASKAVVRKLPGDDEAEDAEISQGTVDSVIGGHAEQSAHAGVDLVPQKEATNAVLKAMEAFALLSTQ